MRFLAGVVTTLVVLAAITFGIMWFGFFPSAANDAYFPMERPLAQHALNARIRRLQPKPPYPYGPPTDETIVAGAKLYMTNCAVCHGSGGKERPKFTQGMYIPPPNFPRHGVADDPSGETYWKIENGIRFTAMPSFAKILTQEQIWQIAYFLKTAPKDIPPAAQPIWNGKVGAATASSGARS